MGLVSFWSNITGPKVKEITPQCETSWFERGRPSTSIGGRFAKKWPESTGQDLDRRPDTANGEKKSKRRGRSLSRPRKSHPVDTEVPRTPIVKVKEDLEDDVPDLPALPASASNARSPQKDLETREDVTSRPSTGMTTEGLQELQIFELPADSIPAETPICSENPLIRPRSKSPASVTKLNKTGQWFRCGAGKNKALPPPPPPRGPLPPIPSTTSLAQRPVPAKVASFQDCNSHSARIRRSHSSSSRPGSRPRFARCSSENNAVLDSFPPVPGLIHDNESTPDCSLASSEVSSVSSPTRERPILGIRNRQVPAPIKVSAAHGHQHKDSAIGTPRILGSPFTPSGVKRWTRHEEGLDDDDIDATGWTDAELEEWDRVGQFMNSMKNNDSYGGAALMRGLGIDADRMRPVTSNSNEQALAELHFGVLK